MLRLRTDAILLGALDMFGLLRVNIPGTEEFKRFPFFFKMLSMSRNARCVVPIRVAMANRYVADWTSSFFIKFLTGIGAVVRWIGNTTPTVAP
jgi:hypothetical protein